MDTNELKAIIRKHFREASPGQGQYVNGSWFEPHHKDSLDDLISDLDSTISSSVDADQRTIERLEEEVERLEGRIEDLKRDNEDEVDKLNDTIEDLRRDLNKAREVTA